MKRKMRKLSLSRETLRNLQAGELMRAVGGACTLEDDTTCLCTDANCNSGGTGGTGGSGAQCPTRTLQDWSCCAIC
ncbi:MAG TPA: hypothetical protein VMW27_19640 [Thermoanaerobaculia bacterium]|nr:hypothetical protein [Thermoanaerobaculia bacterium]